MGDGSNPTLAVACPAECGYANGGGNGYPASVLCGNNPREVACPGWVVSHPCTTRWSSVCSNAHSSGNNDLTVQEGCGDYCLAAAGYGVTKVSGSVSSSGTASSGTSGTGSGSSSGTASSGTSGT